jgi:hypothetical protein
MSKKESFVCYTEWLQYFDMLKTDAERAEIVRAMFLYNIDGTVPDKSTHSTSFMVLFAMMKNQFDRDTEKYQQKVERLRDNAKKSHQANATNCKQMLPIATNCYQIEGDNVNVNDNVNDNEVISNDITKGAKTRKRFIKPTVEEVREYCQERGNTVDPETFVNFYESKGWVVGKSPMKDWKAAVRNWERSRTEKTPPQETYSSFETDEFFQAALEQTRRAMAVD